MSQTKPETEQIRFTSDKTGEHILEDYLEACERTGMTLPSLIDQLFDVDGNFNSNLFQFRIKDQLADNYQLQYRVGSYIDPEAGWVDVDEDIFSQILTDAKAYRDAAAASATVASDQAAALHGTSTTPQTIALGAISLTTQSGKAFHGNNVRAFSQADPTKFVDGLASYSGTSLTITATTISGAGSVSDWYIAVNGTKGAAGEMAGANNLSEITSPATARANLGITKELIAQLNDTVTQLADTFFSSTSFNDFTVPGLYVVSGTYTNGPAGTINGLLQVTERTYGGQTWIFQEYTHMVLGDTTTVAKPNTRMRDATTWAAWQSGGASGGYSGSEIINSAIDVNLTSTSKQIQNATFTAANKSITLGNATTYKTGRDLHYIVNKGTNAFFIKNNAGTMLAKIFPSQACVINLNDNTTSAGDWFIEDIKINGNSLEALFLETQLYVSTIPSTGGDYQRFYPMDANRIFNLYTVLVSGSTYALWGRVITINSDNSLSVGTAVMIKQLYTNQGSDYNYIKCAPITADTFVITTWNGANQVGSTARVVQASGVTLTVGAELAIAGCVCGVCKYDNNKAIVHYTTQYSWTSTQLYAACLTISGTTLTQTATSGNLYYSGQYGSLCSGCCFRLGNTNNVGLVFNYIQSTNTTINSQTVNYYYNYYTLFIVPFDGTTFGTALNGYGESFDSVQNYSNGYSYQDTSHLIHFDSVNNILTTVSTIEHMTPYAVGTTSYNWNSFGCKMAMYDLNNFSTTLSACKICDAPNNLVSAPSPQRSYFTATGILAGKLSKWLRRIPSNLKSIFLIDGVLTNKNQPQLSDSQTLSYECSIRLTDDRAILLGRSPSGAFVGYTFVKELKVL